MNPDKWFDYLDGKLPDWERNQLEEQIPSDPQMQRELAAARRIHANMAGPSGEVLVEDDPQLAARGRKMTMRIGVAFLVLVALNVGIGLWFIARKEASNPNHKLLDEQLRLQIQQSAQRAAAALTPPPLGVSDISIPAAPGQMDKVAEQVVATAQRLGGSAKKKLPEAKQLGVLVDLPEGREAEFRAAIAVLSGGRAASPLSPAVAGDNDARSFVVQIVEAP
jgi:hypothetical protein